MASDGPRMWGQRPYLSPLETDSEYRPLRREGEGRSWGGGSGAPWRHHEWEERMGPHSPPRMENRGSYGVSDMGGRRRTWLPPREDEEEEDGSWGSTNTGPQDPPSEYRSLEKEGRRVSCEPPRKRTRSPPVGEWRRVSLSPPLEDSWESPQKRVWSPPMDKWWRVPLSPPRGRGSTSPDSQRQPSASFSHATHWEPSSSSSRRGSPGHGGCPWVSPGRSDCPARESKGRSWESPEPSWESCRDLERPPPASRRATEGRDVGRSKWLEKPGGHSSSSSRHSTRRDPGWETRHCNPVDGSYSVKAGGSRESWSGRRFQGFRRQVDSRERDNRGLKRGQDEGWSREDVLSRKDWGRSVRSPRENISRKGQGAKASFRGNFLGPKGGPKRYEGHGRQATTTGTFFPHVEVVNYWKRCQDIIRKKARDKFISFCPRPSIPDGSSAPPNVNPDLKQLLGKQAKTLFTITRFSFQTQWDVLTMLAPAMALYEMAEAAMERPEGVDPMAVLPLARSLLSFVGSANRGLTVQRCSEVLQAIDPRLMSINLRNTNQNSSGLLFVEDNVNILNEAIRRLPKLPEEPQERIFGNHREERKSTLIASPPESPPPFRDGSTSLSEQESDQEVELQDQASLELWHRRFGHVDSAAILWLLSNNLAKGVKVEPGEADGTARCLTCLAEKGAKPSFSFHAVSGGTALMDLIHCEFSAPFEVPSLKLQRYVLLFVDDYSRYCFTFLLKETSETHRCFERYLAMLRRTYNLEPKAFQINSVANSVLPQTLALLEARGISHRKDTECVSGQSRTAEREIKSLLGMTRCMLADANLPSPFWGHAIIAATYLWNRLPVSLTKSTPFQAWSGKVPYVNHLRLFGSLVRDREDPNDATQHVCIGYTFSSTEYKVMNLETGVVSSKAGLDFDERQGVEKTGNFLVTLERNGSNIETFTGTDQQDQLQDGASLELWHRRFGHVDSALILRLQNNNLVTGIKVDPGEADGTARCLTCLAVKGAKAPLSLNAVNRSTASMDLVHCELSGPFDVPSLKLQRYVLIFVDDYSRYCVTFLLKETSETHTYFKSYFAMLRKTYKLEPKAFQMNSAADSISVKTHAFLEGRGISHKRDVKCLPGESRTAEREMKSLLEMTRCMLADANLPKPFWGHAILAATYLWNRLAVSRMKRTPFQAWNGKVPCVKHLRVFGSLLRNRENPNDPTQHVYLGYTFSLGQYTVMNLETGWVRSKGGLDFDEQQGIEKRGNFLVTHERNGCDTEVLTGTGESMTPQMLAVMSQS